MNTIRHTLLFLLSICLLSLAACAQQNPSSQYSQEDLTLRRDIGEMLLVGFRGTAIDNQSHIVRDIKDYHIGGVILFEYDAPSGRRPRNITSPDQVRQLCKKLQDLDKETLLIGIDQEGGRVNRLKSKYGFPSFPSHKQTAQQGPDSVRHCAELTAKTLSQLGINLNFAPCVDVDINPLCPVIGKLERSFSANPAEVAQCASIWIDAQRQQGILSCPKHFPGHGSSDADSHLGLVDVSDSWVFSELTPYKMLIDSGKVDLIMTTHVFNAQLDSIYPATLSHKTLEGLLRTELGYNGVIITDDLAMGAMVKQYSYDTILRQTILAGADLLCLSNNGREYDADLVPKTVELIFSMVKQGLIPEERIHQSAKRIRDLKRKIN